MYYGLEAFRHYIRIYQPPFDTTDIGIMDGLLDGDFSIDEDGYIHLTKVANCEGEA